jgi:peptidoglycan/LPS O-acetylase OafA/YrhL
MRVIVAMLLVCSLAVPSFADSGQPRSTGARVGWTLAGVGIGFGAGMYVGFQKFDQATYSERKITATAISFAAAGGLIAFLLTRNRTERQPSADRTRR